MWNEILGNQYKDFAVKAQRPNISLYTKGYKTQIKRIINQMSTKDNIAESQYLFGLFHQNVTGCGWLLEIVLVV